MFNLEQIEGLKTNLRDPKRSIRQTPYINVKYHKLQTKLHSKRELGPLAVKGTSLIWYRFHSTF